MKAQAKKFGRLIAGLTLACSFVVLSVAASPAGSPPGQPADPREQLIALEKDWVAAETNRDTAALRRMLDERFVVTLGTNTYDREGFIGLFAGRPVDPTASQTLTYEAIVIDGDTAVLVGTETAHGTKDGAAYTAVYRYTATYIRRSGQWVALAEQMIKLPPAA